jgi:hypothetical protein
MTKTDGRRRGDPKSDRGITWALVVALIAVIGVAGYLYGPTYFTEASASKNTQSRK